MVACLSKSSRTAAVCVSDSFAQCCRGHGDAYGEMGFAGLSLIPSYAQQTYVFGMLIWLVATVSKLLVCALPIALPASQTCPPQVFVKDICL